MLMQSSGKERSRYSFVVGTEVGVPSPEAPCECEGGVRVQREGQTCLTGLTLQTLPQA